MSTVELHGRPVGRLKASWLLFKETWRFYRQDPEMLWLPLIASIAYLVLFGIVITTMVLLVSAGVLATEEGETSGFVYVFLFALYVIGALTTAVSQAGVAHIVSVRARGGDATLGQGFSAVFSIFGSIFLWALITSTVGLLLNVIARRKGFVGRIVISIIGFAWNVLTYFVIPAMVIDKHRTFRAIGESGATFKRVWGETLVTNFSLGFVFAMVYILVFLSVFGLVMFALATGVTFLLWVSVGFAFVIFFALALLQATLEGVLKTLLYVFASQNIVPENFDRELLERMLVRNNPTTPPTPSMSTVSPQ